MGNGPEPAGLGSVAIRASGQAKPGTAFKDQEASEWNGSAADTAWPMEPSSCPFLTMCVSMPAINRSRAVEVLELERRARDSFDRPMIQLDEVDPILGLAQLDDHAAFGHQAVHGSSIGAALVDRDFLRHDHADRWRAQII